MDNPTTSLILQQKLFGGHCLGPEGSLETSSTFRLLGLFQTQIQFELSMETTLGIIKMVYVGR